MSELYVRNRQRTRPIHLKLFHSIAHSLLAKTCPGQFHLGVLLIGAAEMTRLNERFLQHAGPTDVITFSYSPAEAPYLEAEVFICVDEALRQACRFRIPWQKEIVRYLAHGLLHLCGYDDSTPRTRQHMKAVENRLVEAADREFCLSALEGKPRVRA